MKLKSLALTLGAIVGAFSVGQAVAGTLVVGAPADAGTGNCFPFGCTTWVPQYQQVYAASDFAGSMTIKDLVFYNTQFAGGSPNSGTYTIDLSVTSKAVDGLDTGTLANNIGANDVQVFSGTLSAISGGAMTLALATPYTYDPSGGNLLMDVISNDAGSGNMFFDARNGSAGGLFSRAMTPGCCQNTSDWGLVTGFGDGAGGVPEPATWAMMVLGAGFLGAGLRVSRRATIATA